MNGAATVDNKIINWIQEGHTRAELAVLIAEACIGWPYVWGSYGQECTISNRITYMERSSIAEGDRELIRKRCQRLRDSDQRSSCDGCKYYPGGARTRIFDCRGFTRWVLGKTGISLTGAGATSQWNTAGNWTEKGLIRDMPAGAVCCVFKQKNGKMEHTGLHIGSGNIIHCSVEVKRGKTTDSGWTHYAIPKGMEGAVPVPETRPTLRRGSRGEWVTWLQTKLVQLNYSIGSAGIDGDFGRGTEAGVKEFQRDNGLTADGIVGPKTYDALDKTEPAQLFTVTIPHLAKHHAEALIANYDGATMTEEGGLL